MGSKTSAVDQSAPLALDDETLLAQFEDLLRAVAEEVGQRSVEPHVAAIGRVASAFETVLKRLASGIVAAMGETREQSTAVIAAFRSALEAHKHLEEQMQDRQVAALQAVLGQAEQREVSATQIADQVRQLIQSGFEKTEIAFGHAAESLRQHLVASADELLAAMATQQQMGESLQEMASELGAHRVWYSAQLALEREALVAQQNALESVAADLGHRMDTLGSQLQKVVSLFFEVVQDAKSRDNIAAAAAETSRREIVEHVTKLADALIEEQSSSKERHQMVTSWLLAQRNQAMTQNDQTQARLLALDGRTEEILRILTAPKGMMAWLKRGDER